MKVGFFLIFWEKNTFERVNVVRYQLNTTDLVGNHEHHNGVIKFEEISLFDQADHFVWDEKERIKNFSEENLLKLAQIYRDILQA